MKQYFQSYEDYFWQWEDEGNEGIVVAIPRGSTIAYKDYLGDVIEKLSPQGLPPFGSLLLAIIATNPGGASLLLDIVYRIVSSALKTTDESDLTRAINFLKLLTALPSTFKEGTRRIMVLQVLFERCHNILSARNSEAVLRQYRNGFEIDKKTSFRRDVFEEDFRTLSLLENKFPDVDTILQRIASLPDPNQFKLDFEEHVINDESSKLDLVDALIKNDKTHTVGSLVRWLWGGLNIPAHSSLPSQQPLGGISDLTNKGEFDKLLISEFANDDLFFLSRLANNEALYMHREIPPVHNNLQRLVLIDATLKNWGTPKVMAFALMLAIAKHPKTNIPCSAFVLANETYFPVSIESVEDIIDALHILEGNLHPGKSLEAFLKDFRNDKNKEIFLLTEKSTLTQPGLLKAMNEQTRKINYTILTDASGNIDVYKKERNDNRHVQHIKLPLENLWTKQKVPVKNDLPGSTFNVDYPILLRSNSKAKGLLPAPDGEIFQCTIERSVLRLFEFSDHLKRGWDLVCLDLPYRTEICEIGMTDSGDYILLVFNPAIREITLLNIQTAEKQIFSFDHWKSSTPPSFVFDSGYFYHHNNNGQWSISTRGEVKKVDLIDRSKFEKRRKIVSAAESKYTSNYGVFKNINKVYINASGELVFNIHTLKVIENGTHLKLAPTTDLNVTLSAVSSNDQIFTFEDGSSVEVNRNGLLILRSSDRMVPSIYIPTTLDTALGIATSDEFAGNEYHYKEQTYRVILRSFGTNQADLTKVIEYQLKMNALQITELMAANLPITLIPFCLKQKAHILRSAFTKVGATVDILLPEGQHEKKMKKIPVSEFFSKHVGQYINTIVNYGAKDHRKR